MIIEKKNRPGVTQRHRRSMTSSSSSRVAVHVDGGGQVEFGSKSEDYLGVNAKVPKSGVVDDFIWYEIEQDRVQS